MRVQSVEKEAKEPHVDEDLVLQAQATKSEDDRRFIFGELVLRYQGFAYGYCYAILGDRQLAQDATQEGFLTAYQLLSQLREPRAFSAWLQRILHSHCCRLLKAEKQPRQSLELGEGIAALALSPQILLERSEFQQVVLATIAALPANQQAPVSLYYLDNYSQQEIATRLNLSLAAVKKRLQRARERLAERMCEMAEEYLESNVQERGLASGLFTTVMESAALEGQFVLLETLLMEGMDVNEQDANGQTILHWAAKAGHLEAVELLLHYHADATRRDHTGRTALQLAVEERHSDVAKRLRRTPQSESMGS
jgi:RNA polymerase sigma factor (sigma-70 family)